MRHCAFDVPTSSLVATACRLREDTDTCTQDNLLGQMRFQLSSYTMREIIHLPRSLGCHRETDMCSTHANLVHVTTDEELIRVAFSVTLQAHKHISMLLTDCASNLVTAECTDTATVCRPGQSPPLSTCQHLIEATCEQHDCQLPVKAAWDFP